MSKPSSQRGGTGSRAFLAFKLHRFISGAGYVYATLLGTGNRRVTLDGQRFDPEEPEARLYPLFFCRNCGQEFHPVTLVTEAAHEVAIPRAIQTGALPRHISITQASDEHRNVGSLTPPICMQFIENDEVEALSIRDDLTISLALPGHQQFEHHEVRQQNVRLRMADQVALILVLQGMAGTGLFRH